jgi:hypothetical protein
MKAVEINSLYIRCGWRWMALHLSILLFSLTNSIAWASNDSVLTSSDTIWTKPPKITISGFVDAFYIYDFNKPTTVQRQPFLYNHNRHNEINVNLALVQFSAIHEKYRAQLGMQMGTYAHDNYVNEQPIFQFVNEAYVGISLNKKNNLWVDAGIFNSHLGFESVISAENLILSRSLSSENSPYFLSGARIQYSPSSKWLFLGVITNGWQRIQRVPGNSILSGGTQITYTPSSKYQFNWSTFIGTDDPDSTRRVRFFNNFHGIFHFSDRWSGIAGIDIGFQQKFKGSSDYTIWFTPNIIAQYQLSKNWKTSFRLEYYQDENGVIIPTGTANGFKTFGLTYNLRYSPIPNITCSFETRWFSSKDEIFITPSGVSSNDVYVGTSIALKINSKGINP